MKQARSFSRRQFLRRSTLALGAALAAPAIIPASALGRNGATPPSERLNMGFIGLGGQGSGHLLGGAWTYAVGGYLARENVQVQAVCDVQRPRCEHAQQRCNASYAERRGQPGYNSVKAYNDFREVLARPDIDAVLLALPYHWAAPMSIMAMQAGKDVYCEKPVCITVREGRALIEAARRYGRIFQAGTQQRSEYGGKFRITADLVRNGRLGQLKEVFSYRLPGALYPDFWTADATQPVPDWLDWDLWLGPLSWRPFAGQPMGQTIPGLFVGDVNWAPHHYDVIHWTVNPDPTQPVDIEYDQGNIHFHFSNGVVVHSTGYPGEPVGNEGGGCYVGTQGRLAVDRSNIVSYPGKILEEPLRPDDRRVYHATSHSNNFLECVRTRRPAICNPEAAVAAMNMVLTGGIAIALKRSLKWDPVKEEFPGDAEANRLLAYTPRPPWHI